MHDGDQVVAEYEGATVKRRYIYGTYIDEPFAMVAQTGTLYYHQNRIYHVMALTNSSGQLAERYGYTAYGKRRVVSPGGAALTASAVGNQVGFTGRYHDAETGLTYFRARYMDAELGRFVGRDPWAQRPVFQTVEHLGGRWSLSVNLGGPKPSSMDGYPDGYSMYLAKFVPGGLEPQGLTATKLVPVAPEPNPYPPQGDQLMGCSRREVSRTRVDAETSVLSQTTCTCGAGNTRELSGSVTASGAFFDGGGISGSFTRKVQYTCDLEGGECGDGRKTVGLKGRYSCDSVVYGLYGNGCRFIGRRITESQKFANEGPLTVVVSRRGRCCACP